MVVTGVYTSKRLCTMKEITHTHTRTRERQRERERKRDKSTKKMHLVVPKTVHLGKSDNDHLPTSQSQGTFKV